MRKEIQNSYKKKKNKETNLKVYKSIDNFIFLSICFAHKFFFLCMGHRQVFTNFLISTLCNVFTLSRSGMARDLYLFLQSNLFFFSLDLRLVLVYTTRFVI